MRSSSTRWSLPILLASWLGGCASAPPAPPAVDQAAIGIAIDSVSAVYNAAVAARDTNAIVNMYADDAHLMPANAPRADGKDAVRQGWVGFLSIPGMELTSVSNTKIVSEAGDMVVDLGSFVFKFEPQPGKPITDTGKYTTVFRKVNGEWKIVVDMFNSDIPVTGM